MIFNQTLDLYGVMIKRNLMFSLVLDDDDDTLRLESHVSSLRFTSRLHERRKKTFFFQEIKVATKQISNRSLLFKVNHCVY